MNFKHLQTFVTICECGTVSRAAARLRITQPALSRRIKALQEELGLRLFDNLGRRLSLTSEGNEFLRHGRALLAQAEAVLATGRALGRGRAGVLRIGAAPHTLAAFFPPFVDKYEKRNPGVRVKLFEAGAAELLRMIEHGELHFAVTLALGHDHFAKRQIPAVPLLVLTTPRSRYGAGGTVDVGTLGGVPLLVIAGKEYGSGSSRDWAAKGTRLLGARAVIAESYERIHRSNLIGMGVIPLEFQNGDTRESLDLTGHEVFDIEGIASLAPGKLISVHAKAEDGKAKQFSVIARVDTPEEVSYYHHGGILQYVLRQML